MKFDSYKIARDMSHWLNLNPTKTYNFKDIIKIVNLRGRHGRELFYVNFGPVLLGLLSGEDI